MGQEAAFGVVDGERSGARVVVVEAWVVERVARPGEGTEGMKAGGAEGGDILGFVFLFRESVAAS